MGRRNDAVDRDRSDCSGDRRREHDPSPQRGDGRRPEPARHIDPNWGYKRGASDVDRDLFCAWFLVTGTADPQAEGLQALEHQDYAHARKIFGKIAAADPKDYSALFNLAFAEAALKQDDKAAAHFKQVLVLKPGLYEAELNLGMLYERDQQAAEAVPLLKMPSNRNPRWRARSATSAKRCWIREIPREPPMRLQRRQDWDRRRPPPNWVWARASPEKASWTMRCRTTGSGRARSQNSILRTGIALGITSRLSVRKPPFRCYRSSRKMPGAREELGQIYLDTGQPDEAVQEFQAAVASSPTTANRMALASAYLKTSHPELAEPILQEALRANPNDFDVNGRAVSKIEMGKRNYRGGRQTSSWPPQK